MYCARAQDIVIARLKRWTRNPLGSARRGSDWLGLDSCALLCGLVCQPRCGSTFIVMEYHTQTDRKTDPQTDTDCKADRHTGQNYRQKDRQTDSIHANIWTRTTPPPEDRTRVPRIGGLRVERERLTRHVRIKYGGRARYESTKHGRGLGRCLVCQNTNHFLSVMASQGLVFLLDGFLNGLCHRSSRPEPPIKLPGAHFSDPGQCRPAAPAPTRLRGGVGMRGGGWAAGPRSAVLERRGL